MTEQTEGQTFTTESDPADFTADAVVAYLKDADESERQRVFGLETGADGKDRKTVKDAATAAPEPSQGDGTTPGLDTSKAATFQEAAEGATESEHPAYAQGYFGHVPSRDGDKPVDLTLAGVTGQSDKDA